MGGSVHASLFLGQKNFFRVFVQVLGPGGNWLVNIATKRLNHLNNKPLKSPMKTRSFLIAALSSIFLGITAEVQASITFLTKIVEISPAQAMVGQTITVRTESPNTAALANSLAKLPEQLRFRRGVVPGLGSSQVKIFFTGANGQQTVEGQNVTPLGNNRYSVRVPNGARSGRLRLQRGAASSLSTPSFTLVSAGYGIDNYSQFDIISIKVDNVERLHPQVVRATSPSSPTVEGVDVGATPGNHSLQVTLGRSPSEPVMVYALPAVAATNPLQGVRLEIMKAGEYLVASPVARISGTSITASWQTFIFDPAGNHTVNGFDFTFNQATGVTTWRHWLGTQTNVVRSGNVVEPTNWALNPASVRLQLRAGAQLYTEVVLNFQNASFFAVGDGRTYNLQEN